MCLTASFAEQAILASFEPQSTYVAQPADVDGDGDLDVLGASPDGLYWLKNHGTGDFATPTFVDSRPIDHLVQGDVDDDGDQDVVAADWNANELVWYQNQDGQGNFSSAILVDALADVRGLQFADLDSDGDRDLVFGALTGPTGWFENTGSGFSTRHDLYVNGASDSAINDMDGDGDLDVVISNDRFGMVGWFQNGGNGSFSSIKILNSVVGHASDVELGDIDGDGDLDIAASSPSDHRIGWFANIDGFGQFGPFTNIATGLIRARTVRLGDVDADGDLDAVAAVAGSDEILEFENNGSGSFSPAQRITDRAHFSFALNLAPGSLRLADLDSDGDEDLVAATPFDDQIEWFENEGGEWTTTHRLLLTFDRAISIEAADLDGDGDLDILAGSQDDDHVSWFENVDSLSSLGPQQTISPLSWTRSPPIWMGTAI